MEDCTRFFIAEGAQKFEFRGRAGKMNIYGCKRIEGETCPWKKENDDVSQSWMGREVESELVCRDGDWICLHGEGWDNDAERSGR